MSGVRAHLKNMRVSPQKLNLVAETIRRQPAVKSVEQLKFSRKRIAKDVQKVLESAISNAENNHGMDIDNLYIAEAYVGKGMVMKRWRARARGRVGRIMKPFSNLTIILKEMEA